MSRIETIGRATLILGDANDVAPTLKGHRFAVLSDPPYGQDYKHRVLGGIVGDDRPFDPRPFLIGEHHTLWGAHRYASRLPDQTRWLMWLKHDPGLFGKRTHAPFDLAWTDLGGSGRALKHIWDASIREGEWYGRPNCHPHQKPVELLAWCMEMFPADLRIVDFFMGSGSAAVAALKLGRYYTGIEIDERWFDIACERADEAARQPDLLHA